VVTGLLAKLDLVRPSLKVPSTLFVEADPVEKKDLQTTPFLAQ